MIFLQFKDSIGLLLACAASGGVLASIVFFLFAKKAYGIIHTKGFRMILLPAFFCAGGIIGAASSLPFVAQRAINTLTMQMEPDIRFALETFDIDPDNIPMSELQSAKTIFFDKSRETLKGPVGYLFGGDSLLTVLDASEAAFDSFPVMKQQKAEVKDFFRDLSSVAVEGTNLLTAVLVVCAIALLFLFMLLLVLIEKSEQKEQKLQKKAEEQGQIRL